MSFDRNKVYGIVTGAENGIRFVQGERYYDGDGNELDSNGKPVKGAQTPAPKTAAAAPAKKSEADDQLAKQVG